MEDYTFLPNYTELHGELYYTFKDGRLIKVDDKDCELFKTIELYKPTGVESKYLQYAFYDNLNPFIEKKCESCGNALMRHVVLNKTNIYVCECGKYVVGDKLS